MTIPQHALLDPQTVEWIAGLTGAHLSDEQHIALALMRGSGTVSNEMLRAWGIGSHAATSALRGLVDHGLALNLGGRRYATYELADDPERRLDLGLDIATGSRVRPARGRINAELQAVVEAVRAGHVTATAISKQLGLSYTTTTRRINVLLESGRIRATAAPHSRTRSFIVVGADGPKADGP